MALVRSAARAHDLGPDHPVAVVADRRQVILGERRGEARPAGPALEFLPAVEQRQPAQPAGVNARPLLIEEHPAERRFGAMLEKHVPLLVGERGFELAALIVGWWGQIELDRRRVGHGGSSESGLAHVYHSLRECGGRFLRQIMTDPAADGAMFIFARKLAGI